jgi:ribonuclease HI
MSDEAGKAVDIFADGACSGAFEAAGWGALLRYRRHEKEICGGAAATNSDRMELAAPMRALETLTRSCVVRIHTGSAYVRDGVTRWLPRWKANGWQPRDNEPVEDTDLWRQVDDAMEPHDVSWHWFEEQAGNPDNVRASQLATEGLRQVITEISTHRVADDDRECVHEMPIGWCALCKPPRPGVLPRGYRTEAGSAYHNDPSCTWMHRGQRRAERQGKNVHDIVGVVWGDVLPGELEPCEACCTPQWLKRHGY